MRGLYLGARQRLDCEIVAQRLASFAPDGLALACGERIEEIIEVAVAFVEKVKLFSGTERESGVLQRIASAC